MRLVIVVCFVIDVKFDIEFFGFCGVIIDLLLYKIVILGVIDPDDKSVLWLGFVIDLNLLERIQAV